MLIVTMHVCNFTKIVTLISNNKYFASLLPMESNKKNFLDKTQALSHRQKLCNAEFFNLEVVVNSVILV